MKPSLAVDIASQHHYSIFVFLVLGLLLHVLWQIQAQVTSRTNNAGSWMEVIEKNWTRLALRSFASLCVFMGFWHDPSAISDLLKAMNVNIGPTLTAFSTIPMGPWFAGMFGLCADTLLTFIPMLRNVLPPSELSVTDTHIIERTVTKDTHQTTATIPVPSEPKASD